MINKIGLKFVINRIWQSQYYFARIKFPLPDLGEKIKEGTVKKLYVNEGDKVS